MPKVICKHARCKALVEKGMNGGYCDEHIEYGQKLKEESDKFRLKSYNKTRKDTIETAFYNDPAWNHPKHGAKVSALARDNYLCQDCLDKGITNTKNLEVHHIVPLKENFELRLVLSNLRTLCRSCHKKADDKFKKYKMK